MLIYDVLHKETVYHSVISDLRSYGVKYRFKKSMFKIERPGGIKYISKKVFKTPLLYQSLDVVNLSSGAIVHVPAFVSQASTFLEGCITQEGLFRKAGSQLRQKELIARLDNGGALGEKHHAIDVANCLKTFFRELPEPLIPYTYHDLFVHCVMLKSYSVEALLLACILLPPHHLNTLAFFMEFLKRVSLCEKQNKMGIDNLAKVVGPNIMPLQETTMSAVQMRLELHLTIIKILIENAECIGILPDHISQEISMETIGSTDYELDVSDHSHSKYRKKKYRSGSLTRKPHLSASNLNLRMFNGLKKIVGKNAVLEDTSSDNHKITENCDTTNTSNIKHSKKRKVDYLDPASAKKKKITDKAEKSKRLRLSLDRFVPKRPKAVEDDPDLHTNAIDTRTERRWSSVCNACDSQRTYRPYSDGSTQLKLILKDNEVSSELHKEYNDMFIDADVNLSDDSDEQVSSIKDDINSTKQSGQSNLSSEERRFLDNFKQKLPKRRLTSNNFEKYSHHQVTSLDNQSEEYVTIPKSEYEEIKNRVSAIESRLSQEFGCVNNENSGKCDELLPHSVKKVQTAYEKTLEEASIENTVTTDYLAKKLGKELKIRRSADHKIIRSPSARKIGTLRRRSQERTMSKRVKRTASWHISHGSELPKHLRIEQQSNQSASNDGESSTLTCTEYDMCLRPISTSFWQQEQSNIVITNMCNKSNLQTKNTAIRRVSSFHGNEYTSTNSVNLEKLKKSNSQQNIILNNTPVNKLLPRAESWKKAATSWKDADRYFKSASQTNSPVTQTGRASIAKLRAQNAGMVLAKAKLFDECRTKVHTQNNAFSRKNDLSSKKFHLCTNSAKENNEQIELCWRSSKNIISRNPKLILGQSSSRVSMDVENTALNINPNIDRYCCISKGSPLTNTITHQKENVSTETRPSAKKMPRVARLNEPGLSTYNTDNSAVCKTPHIKKPLTVNTPKSAKALSRKPIIDSRRTPLKAVDQLGTPKYQSPKGILKATRGVIRYT